MVGLGNRDESFNIGGRPFWRKVVYVLLDVGKIGRKTIDEDIFHIHRVNDGLELGAFLDVVFLCKDSGGEGINRFARFNLSNEC